MKNIEIFVQGEGLKDVVLVKVPEDGSVRDLIEAARGAGAQVHGEDAILLAFIEEAEEPLAADITLKEAGVHYRQHVHVHRTRKIQVTVTFNGRQESGDFPPSATLGRVKKWATRAFGMSELDATEHVLQVASSTIQPDEHAHVGTLVVYPNHHISFDLVPKVRVEG
jgi:hypothetical protein